MKKPKAPTAWSVYLLRRKATLLGLVHASDEAEAIKTAIRDLQIRRADQFRVAARLGW